MNQESRFVRWGSLVAFACATLVAGPAAAQVRTIEGTTADGASYLLAMPAAWNGDLVAYAHGIVDPGAPVAVPTTQDGFIALRDGWLALGYAVASSSFSDNGYALKSAVQRTHQLRGLFTAAFQQPSRTFLVGHSLGGLAVLALAERYPEQYDGALPMCTPIGGGSAEIAYLGDARVAFDYFFPGVLPGGAFSVPEGLAFTPGSPVFTATLNALAAGGLRTFQFGQVARLPFTTPTELVMSGMSVVGFSIRFTNDVMDRTHEHVPFDNIDRVYTGSFDDASLNDPLTGVARFAATPDAVSFFEQYYTPTGDLRIPTLTLHTLLDPIAPFAHEAAYATRVLDTGASAWLTQRSVAAYGHCNINAAETMSAFSALIGWANGGTKPAGGDGTIR
jgi:pimeloyl-ACP methyl ester carboxylesterase